MKKYLQFILEKLRENQEMYLQKIINYLKNNAPSDLFGYGEDFTIKKKGINKELTGKLFFVLEPEGEFKEKAIRFNFDKEQLYSVDFWEKFEFNYETIHNKPDYTVDNVSSFVNVVDDIVAFMDGDFDVLNEKETQAQSEFKKAPEEEVDLKGFDKAILDEDVDVFDSIRFYTSQVAFGISNSLVVSGLPGLGKSFDIEKTLEDMRRDYVPVSGDITTSGLFEILFKNRTKLILFDDMDSVFDNKESINLLKAVLDTKPKRKVSRILKTHFDSFGMSDDEIQRIYDETGKLPKQFEFTGRIIFITNEPGDKIDSALISRSLFVDVNPDFDKVLDRINSIIPNIKPSVPIKTKKEIIDFMLLMNEQFELRFPVNLRTFIHCLNIRVANEGLMMGNLPAWQALTKLYLIKK